ncbi:MAG TPA: hypothetical protein DD417_15970 [Elusimicrobia bacterium]|nr:hypothetical protein [Elusimicrobiota bacterium]
MGTINPLTHPLSIVFSAPSHLAVLRALCDSREGMSGRAVSRAAGINHQACAVALKKLGGLGLIRRQGAGRVQLVSLNFDHFLVRDLLLPALRKERELMSAIRDEIAGKVGKYALAASLFGSVARGTAETGSDLDMLLVVAGSIKRSLADKARDFSAEFRNRYGIRLSPIVLSVKEAKTRLEQDDPLILNILAEGIDLGPKKLKDILG